MTIGSLGEWVAGLATVAAVVLALYQFWTIQQRQEQAERRSQAVAVTTWFDNSDPYGRFYISNTSGAPIYEVAPSLVYKDDEEVSRDESLQSVGGFFAVVPPGLCEIRLTKGQRPPDSNRILMTVALSFTDTSGVNWYRSNHGRLSEVRVGARQGRSGKSDNPNDWVCTPVTK